MSTKVTILDTATSPVSIQEVLDQLNETEDAQTRDVLQVYISAAREMAEAYTHQQIMPAMCELYLPCFYSVFELTKTPFVSLTSISYYDADNLLQTLAQADYELNDKSLFAIVSVKNKPLTYPRHDAVKVTYTAGYANGTPATIKQAMLLMIADWYQNREDSKRDIPRASEFLLNPYRVISFY